MNLYILPDPVEMFIDMIDREWRYRCTVDGDSVFRGEHLPVGTLHEIKKWFHFHYPVLGKVELWSFDSEEKHYLYEHLYQGIVGVEPMQHTAVLFQRCDLHWSPGREKIRLVVNVGDCEKLFVLERIPFALLGWNGRSVYDMGSFTVTL